MRPFEVLFLEIVPKPVMEPRPAAQRDLGRDTPSSYHLPIRSLAPDAGLEIHFADGAQLEAEGCRKQTAAFEVRIPGYPGRRHHLAIVTTFRSGGRPCRTTGAEPPGRK